MTKSILLTGGLGYVGGRVAEELTRNCNYEIAVTTRYPERADLPGWLPEGRCKKLDVMNDEDARTVCRDIDTIVHFAAVNEIESARDPVKAFCVNSLGTLKLIRAAEEAGVKRFIYFSTAHIYHSPLQGIISEETSPRPVHPYAITHRSAEDFVLAANSGKDMHGIVIRLSNSIGAPVSAKVDRWSLVGNDFCRQAITERMIRIKTSGIQIRDFIPLHDVARATEHMIELPRTMAGDGIFNLGGECTLSIYDLALRIQDQCRSVLFFTPPIYRAPLQPGETAGILQYSIERLKSTGFTLAGDIDDEIKRMLLFCQREVGAL